jgi:hypothetical protein
LRRPGIRGGWGVAGDSTADARVCFRAFLGVVAVRGSMSSVIVFSPEL